MFSKKNLSIGMLMIGMTLTLSACSLGNKGPEKAPEEVVKEAMQNMYDVKSGDYSFMFDGEVKNLGEADTMGFQQLNFDGEISGVYDVRDLAAMKMSMMMNMNGKRDKAEKNESVKVELRFVGDKAYFVLNDITDFEGNIPAIFVEPFKNQWYTMAVPPDIMESMLAGYKDEAELTEDEKKMKVLYENSMFFKDVKYEGSEDVYGENSYKYSMTLDKAALKEYLEEVAKLSDEEILPTDVEDLDEFLGKMEMTGSMWISKDDMLMRKMMGDVTVKNIENVDVKFEITYGMPTLGGDVKLEVPADAQEFDPASMFGGIMGLPEGTELEIK